MEEDRPSVAGTSPPLKLMLNLYSTSDSISLTIWTVLEMTSSASLTLYTLLSNWKETAEQGEGTGRETSVIYSYRKKQDRQRRVLSCRSSDKLAGWLLPLAQTHHLNTAGSYAQRGLRYLVCVPVSTYSRTTGTKPAHEQYQRL